MTVAHEGLNTHNQLGTLQGFKLFKIFLCNFQLSFIYPSFKELPV